MGQAGSFLGGALGNGQPAFGDRRLIEEAGHAGNQATPRDLKLRSRKRERGGRTAYRIQLLRADCLRNAALADVFVNLIVGDETDWRCD